MRLTHQIPTIPAGAHTFTDGGVVAPHQVAVSAGEAMYARGGNAVDAAVAAALVAGVMEPAETTLAGCGFMLVGMPDGEVVSVEFGPRAPKGAGPHMYRATPGRQGTSMLTVVGVEDNANADGPLAAGVPRTLLALLTAQERFGTLPRETVLGPAIAVARDGFSADPWFRLHVLSDIERLRADPAAAAVFLDEDGLPRGQRTNALYGFSQGEEEPVPQPLLARTLETVAAEGPDALRTGSVASALLATARERGMLLSAEDLAESGPDIGAPRTLAFRDTRVHVPQAPGGGPTELEILNVWQHLYPGGSPYEDTAERIRGLALAIRHSFADRFYWLGDPDLVDVPVDDLLSDAYAGRLARQIAGGDVPRAFTDGTIPWSHFANTMLHDPRPGGGPAPWTPDGGTEPASGTTHISAGDASGLFVSITHTAAHHFGSGTMCPRTGLLFDAAMVWFNALPGAANSVRSGARPLANMGPAMLTRDGRAVAALGASGGRRIISAVAQLVINLVDRGMTPLEALQAPRIDGSGPRVVLHEHLAEAEDGLAPLATYVTPPGNTTFTADFARANLVGRLADGRLQSAIDAGAFAT